MAIRHYRGKGKNKQNRFSENYSFIFYSEEGVYFALKIVRANKLKDSLKKMKGESSFFDLTNLCTRHTIFPLISVGPQISAASNKRRTFGYPH